MVEKNDSGFERKVYRSSTVHNSRVCVRKMRQRCCVKAIVRAALSAMLKLEARRAELVVTYD